MPDSKITALDSIGTGTDPANDPLVIVDVSDVSPSGMSATGTTKKVTLNNLLACSPTATLASATITGDLTVDTNTLKVDSTNDRVGIGTATPAAKLIVRDGTNRNLLVSSDATQLGSTGIAIGGFTDNAAGYAPLSLIASAMQFGIGGSTAMTLNSTGLGVGRSPSYKLDIAGVGNFDQLRVSAAAATNVALVNTTSGLTYTVYSANTASNGFNGFGIFDGSSYVLRIDSSGNTTLASATITGNTTLGDAQTDTATINGQLTARQGEFPSAVRAAASDYAAVTFDGATSGTRITSTLTGQNIGTGDFSLWSRFRVPALAAFTSNPAVISLGSVATDGSGNNSFRIVLLSGGNLSIRSNDGAGVSTNSDVSGFSAAYSGQVVDIVVTRTGSTVKLYINGTDTAITGSLNGSNSITSTYCHTGIGTTNATIFTGRIYRSVVFNRALSASDVTELITVGVNPADQWGTQTQVANTTTLNGGFETAGGGGADPFANWVEFTTGTTTITRDTAVFSPNLSSTASANFTTDALNSVATTTLSNTLLPSKRFRLSFDFRHNGAAAAGPQYNFGSGSDLVGTATAANTWTSYVVESIAGGTAFAFSRASGAGASKTSWYDNTIIERIGAIVDLDFTVGTGYQATDRSTNNLHGTLFNGVEFTQPKRVAVLYATTSAATNQQVFGTLAIPTNAIIEDIIVNSTGTATVTIRDAVAGAIIVNAASVVAGRQKLTIAQPFSSGGQLWVQSSTTATLQFTILYTIAA